MKTARIEIEYAPRSDADITEITVQNEETSCNVSNPEEIKVTSYFKGYKGFHLSDDVGITSVLDGTNKYYDDMGYPGYCSRALSDENGNIDVTLWLYINYTGTTTLKDLTIQFDKVAEVFACDLEIGARSTSNVVNVVNNTSYKCYVNIESLQLLHNDVLIIKFTKLNKPNENLRITKIMFTFTGSYNDNIIKNFKCSEQLMDTIFNINPTVIEQYAEITFKDKYKEFKRLAKEELLSDNSEVDIYLGDELIGTYLTESWDLQGSNTSVSLNCNDPSKAFDNSYIKELKMEDRTLHKLLSIGFAVDKLNWKYIDKDTQQYCEEFVAHNSWVYESTLREYFKKVCLIGLLRIYWFKDTFIVARCY